MSIKDKCKHSSAYSVFYIYIWWDINLIIDPEQNAPVFVSFDLRDDGISVGYYNIYVTLKYTIINRAVCTQHNWFCGPQRTHSVVVCVGEYVVLMFWSIDEIKVP